MNALSLLRDDHRHLKQLLHQLAATGADAPLARQGLVERLEHDLGLHAQLEQDVFYPALVQAGGQEEATMEAQALEEHRILRDQVLPDLLGVNATDPRFEGRARALKELVEHHVMEEERDMFPRAQALLDTPRLEALGQQMARRRAEWFATGQRGHASPAAAGVVEEGLARLGAGAQRLDDRLQALARDPLGGLGQLAQAMACGLGRVGLEVGEGVRRGLAQARETRNMDDPGRR